ncbi:hypothetical protein [Halobacillus hunanensis]|uniref:hypothetical protein n=1 Tax=Halobacillus hunanensis TaxID=578214 RepID=UPI0009A7F797|nr:hypothetical protein [Halobacillus hunanensis]
MDKKKFEEYTAIKTSPGDIRFHALIHVLLFTDLLGFGSLLGDPKIPFFIYLAIIPVIILNLWLILYLVAPYKFELSFVLFYGVWGVLTSFLYFLVTQKFLYTIVQFESLLFFYLGLAFYLITIVSVLVTHYLSLYDKVKIPDGPGAWPRWLAIVPGVGYLFAQLILSAINSDDIKALLFVGCVILTMLYPILMTRLTHQYFFLRKHKKEVMKIYSGLGKPKKDRKFDKKNSNKHKRKTKRKKNAVN